MFQPNSIRSLLRRKEEKLIENMSHESKMPSEKSIYDPDI